MSYDWCVVADGELPDGIQRVIVQRVEGDPLLILSETAATTWRPVPRLNIERAEGDPDAQVLHELPEVPGGC